ATGRISGHLIAQYQTYGCMIRMFPLGSGLSWRGDYTMPVDRAFFAANFPSAALSGKKLTASRKQGFNAIFDAWDAMGTSAPLSGLAYALATAWHETGGRMQPVREGFKTTDAAAYAAV